MAYIWLPARRSLPARFSLSASPWRPARRSPPAPHCWLVNCWKCTRRCWPGCDFVSVPSSLPAPCLENGAPFPFCLTMLNNSSAAFCFVMCFSVVLICVFPASSLLIADGGSKWRWSSLLVLASAGHQAPSRSCLPFFFRCTPAAALAVATTIHHQVPPHLHPEYFPTPAGHLDR